MIGFHFVSQRIGVMAIVMPMKPQRPDAGFVGDGLDRIGAELAPERVVDKPGKRAEGSNEHGGLDDAPNQLRLSHECVERLSAKNQVHE